MKGVKAGAIFSMTDRAQINCLGGDRKEVIVTICENRRQEYPQKLRSPYQVCVGVFSGNPKNNRFFNNKKTGISTDIPERPAKRYRKFSANLRYLPKNCLFGLLHFSAGYWQRIWS
ncbi:hypothetical protein [Geitlerinema sp. PCC 7407]|uniref:hypothetical protein n=1 Tax=Geitlerinema sp. PCC 7407 TaxID=1173025 RepID=UPI0012371C8F|nr:hypothetical protein [Geitlerinema sp. PCC 7407]